MANKVIEKNIPLINYVEEVRDGDVSDNQDVQRYFCSDEPFINGIAITVLTGDYLPPLILAEVPLVDDIVQKYIADGLQRTTALMRIRYGNYKFKGSMEDNIIEYQAKKLDDEGNFLRDDNGTFVWEKKTFDIKGKTYDDFPKELKKRFDNYQLRIASYQNCTMEMVSKLVRKLNNHKGMNASQKALTWIPTYARKIKEIANSGFFKNSIDYSDTKRKNGEYMQLVCRSVMNVFHFGKYKRGAKDVSYYLEENGNIEEFNIIHDYFDRLEKLSGEKFKNLFVNKDIPIWLVVFDKFTKTGLEDSRFADFLNELNKSLHSKEIEGNSYDLLYKATGTTDKKLVTSKIKLYTTIMKEYLHIDETETENNIENRDICHDNDTENVANEEENVLDFVKENVNPDATDKDVDACYELVDYAKNKLYGFNKQSALLDYHNENALIAVFAYALKNNIDLDQWLVKLSNQNNTYSDNQKENYTYMVNSLNNYIQASA